jgi:multidrug transporter EmrE-like cation transporter
MNLACQLFLVMILLTFVESIAIFSIKKYETSGNWKFFILAGLINGIMVTYLFLRALKYKGVGMTNFIWNIFSTLLVFLIGIYFFKETITNYEYIGIILILVGMILLSIHSSSKS